MRTYPLVIVTAAGPDQAFDAAEEFLDYLVENADGYFDGAKVDRDVAPLQGRTSDYRAAVENAYRAEAAMVQQYWDILRSAIGSVAAQQAPPANDDRLPVRYRQGFGIIGLIEAGHEIEGTQPFSLVLYEAHKWYILREHMSDRTGTHPGSDGSLYDAREDTSVPPEDAGSGTYAVGVDLHY